MFTMTIIATSLLTNVEIYRAKVKNATLYSSQFYMTNGFMTVYARKFARLIMKNILFTENTLSQAWLVELLPDWSKQKFGFRSL